MQPYFKHNKIDIKTVRDIFKFQTRLSNLKDNFKNLYKEDQNCPIPNCSGIDNQRHLLEHSDFHIDNKEGYYNKLFSSNPDDNLEIIKVLKKSMDQRQMHLNDENEK